MRIATPALVAGLFALAPALMGDMRQDEFLCEEAYARLADCCPGFTTTNPGGYCEFLSSCEDGNRYPALSIQESNCIRAESCADLVSTGVCQRAAGVQQQGYQGPSSGVCP